MHEAFGRAALEARCAGLPVVAMAQGGVGEYIRHGESGLLARDDDELARHLALLADDDALHRRLAAVDPRLEPYDWASIILAHEQAYRDALAILGQSAHTPGGISIGLGGPDQRGDRSGAGQASPE
jgi:glycosyltransferase involved in cell wall biosynthesis